MLTKGVHNDILHEMSFTCMPQVYAEKKNGSHLYWWHHVQVYTRKEVMYFQVIFILIYICTSFFQFFDVSSTNSALF